MEWKTIGAARREAAGMKKRKEYLEFKAGLDSKKPVEGIIHTQRDCKAIKPSSHIRFFHFFEDTAPKEVSCKIGRGAWIRVSREKECPHCQEETKK